MTLRIMPLLALVLLLFLPSSLLAQEKDHLSLSLIRKKVLTQSELEKLSFPPPMKDVKERQQGFGLGLWMAKREFVDGEPVYALLVVKNYTKKYRGLRMWFTTKDRYPRSGSRLHLTALDPPKYKPRLHLSKITSWCTDAPPCWMKPNGYMCLRVDLFPRTQPGRYKLHWSFGDMRSPEVHFRVVARNPAPKRPDILGHYDSPDYWLTLYGEMKEIDPQTGSVNFLCRSLYRNSIDGISKNLTTGMTYREIRNVENRYYPDVYDLPTRDECLQVSAKIVPAKHKSGVSMEVTLHPVKGGKLYDLEHVRFSLNLIVIPDPTATRVKRVAKFRSVGKGNSTYPPRKAISLRDTKCRQNLTMRVDIPPDWAKLFSFHGKARCALVLSDHPIRSGVPWTLTIEHRAVIGLKSRPRWRGVVRTPWLALDIEENALQIDAQDPTRKK